MCESLSGFFIVFCGLYGHYAKLPNNPWGRCSDIYNDLWAPHFIGWCLMKLVLLTSQKSTWSLSSQSPLLVWLWRFCMIQNRLESLLLSPIVIYISLSMISFVKFILSVHFEKCQRVSALKRAVYLQLTYKGVEQILSLIHVMKRGSCIPSWASICIK